MKTIKFILLFVMCIALIMGCAKDDQIENQDEMILKKASMTHVVIVEPNGVDDTENLKNAFADAMVAGHGSMVKLVEGEYHIDLIEIREFHGILKGAGKGKTVVTTIGDLNVDDFLNQNLQPNLLCFVGGDVCVCDLTIHTPEAPFSTGMIGWLHGQLSFSAVTSQYIAENEHISAVVDNVEFISQGGLQNGLLAESSFFNGIPGGVPLADIDISVSNCSFSGPYWWAYGALLMEIREGNIKSIGNEFNNCDLGIWHNINIHATVNNNKFWRQGGWFPLQIVNGPYPSLLQQLPQTFQSVCNIEKNTFNVSNSTGAILINDRRRVFFPDEMPRLVQVKNNKIHTEGGGFTAMGGLNLSGAVIRNNKFTGEAGYGVRLFSQSGEIYSDNGLMLGNNFSNAEYSITTVLLGNGTRNWTIVGGNIGELVADYGENNLISGFNNNTSDIPFGQTIADNLEEMKGPMHNLK